MSVSSRNLTLRGLVVVAGAILVVAIVAIGLTIWALRVDAAASAARDTGNLSTVLAEQSARTVQAVDIVLADLKERIAAMGISTPDDFRNQTGTKDFFNTLTDRLGRLPQAASVGVLDDKGILWATTRNWPRQNLDLSDREFFFEHQRSNQPRLYVSTPTQNRVNRAWTVQFSRRIDGPSGEFIGVIFVGVDTAYFKEIFGTIETLHNQKITLARSDGVIITEHPGPDSIGGLKIPSDSPWHRLVAQGGGHFHTEDSPEDQARLMAVRPLQSYPLVVSVGVTEESAYATWRRRTTFIAIGTLLIAVCTAFLVRALLSQFHALLASERSRAEGNLRVAEKTAQLERANIQIDAALNNITQGVCMFDEHSRIVVFNHQYLEMYGLSHDIVKPGCTLLELIAHRKEVGLLNGDPQAYCEGIIATIKAGKTASSLIETTDGRVIYAVQQPMLGGGWVVTHEDITERRQAEARTAFIARHDALTGLANRLHLLERIEEEFARLRRKGAPFTVFAFDLDLFKAVNDSLGHPTGDALLKAVAERIRECTRDHVDIVARLGGDEFVLVQSVPEQQRENAIILANRLMEKITAPYEIDGHQIIIGTSIGIALAPNDGDNADELLKNADLALYRVKSEGRNGYRLFEAEMNDEAQSRHVLQADLRASLVRNEFDLHYQTVFDAKTRKPCGAEALVRWRHPVRGIILPGQFVQLAEEIGVIVPLGEWILREACSVAVSWPPEIKLAVNLSPAQFRSPNLVDMVAATLAETGLPPDRLELEITESVLLQKSANNLTVLYQLKSLGLSIVLDDFGTGYSSLSYLRMFPFDKIKIDRSFVDELSTRADCAAIVCAVVGLGHGLNIVTTAEGVETEEQRLLRAAGVGQVQGFLLRRPLPNAELNFHTLLEERAA
jgi:diguanylate cyclase (GGDEF)-like protein